ncbi:MAG: C50 carotenoid epsilon cyclase, partial [uncultured Nocardioidaceae bacterium]
DAAGLPRGPGPGAGLHGGDGPAVAAVLLGRRPPGRGGVRGRVRAVPGLGRRRAPARALRTRPFRAHDRHRALARVPGRGAVLPGVPAVPHDGAARPDPAGRRPHVGSHWSGSGQGGAPV